MSASVTTGSTGEQREALTLGGAIGKYFTRTGIRTDEINPLTLEVPTNQSNPHGCPERVDKDIEAVLDFNDIDIQDLERRHGQLPEEFGIGVILVVGAALYRDGRLPQDLVAAVDAVGGPAQVNHRIGDIQ